MKYDSYRLLLERDRDRARLLTRGGTSRLPWIIEASRKNRHGQFVMDGDAVLLAFTGISDFDGLHSRRHDEEVQLYAFDVLAMDGDDLRRLPPSMRKNKPRACSSARRAASSRQHLSKARLVRHWVKVIRASVMLKD